MTATAMLFGVAVSQLFAAIAEVESGNGRTSDNVYQIQRVYLDDIGRIYGCHFSDEVMTDRHASEQVMLAYLEYYGEQNPDLAPLPKKGIVLSATEDELRAVRFPKMQGELALVPSEAVCNAAKVREALKVANETADELLKWIWNHYQELNCMGGRLKRAIEGALAEPPLPSKGENNPCTVCPCCGKISFGKCEFAWAQMPYTESEAGK